MDFQKQAFAIMALDTISTVLSAPEDTSLAVNATLDMMRQLSGAKAVALFTDARCDPCRRVKLAGVVPPRRRKDFDGLEGPPFLQRLPRFKGPEVLRGEEASWPQSPPPEGDDEAVSVLLPLQLGPNNHGFILLRSIEENPRLDSTLQLMGTLAEVMGLTLSNAFLIAQKQQIIEQLEQAHKTIQEAEERFRMLLDRAADAMFLADLRGNLVEVNRKACQALGYSREELLELSVGDVESGRVTREILEMWKRMQLGQSAVVEGMHRRKDGSIFPVEVNVILIPWKEETFVLGLARDVSERKQAEEALRRSEARFRAVVEQAGDAMFVHDLEGRFLDVNRAACQRLGYSREELLGLSVSDIDPECSQVCDQRELWDRLIANGGNLTLENRHLAKQGESFPVEVTLGAIEYRGQKRILAIARDITERKKAEAKKTELESQLKQAQKMEALGVLAGGIAHEFNNILAVIMGYGELALDSSRHGMKVEGEIEEILKASERAKKLVAQILTFTRKAIVEKIPLSLNEVIEDSLAFLKKILPAAIRLKTRLAPDLGCVYADWQQMEQILVNLVSNARDAMPQGGPLKLATENVKVNRRQCLACARFFSGEYVRLTVEDAGVGMSPETLQKIFDPFFTTKEVGKGTGLGLSTVFGIVKAQSGHIVCQSRPDRGTRFEIYLPVLAEKDFPHEALWARTGEKRI